MKNLLFALTAVLFLTQSCSKSGKELLIGSWSLTTETNNGVINTANVGLMATFDACAGSVCNGFFNFKGNTDAFTYVLSADEKTLIITNSSKNVFTQTVTTLSSTQLTITTNSGSSIDVVTFKKI